MVPQKLQAIVLAAGRSSRFNTSKTKLSFTLCGQELILYPIKLLAHFEINSLLVLGYQKEVVLEVLKKHTYTLPYIEQIDQKGTGHALLQSKTHWTAEHILVMNGDMPLISEAIIQSLLDRHFEKNATLSLVIAHNSDPSVTGYGRVIQEKNRISIVEARDLVGDPSTHCCLNAGIYLFKRTFLERYLSAIHPHPFTGELFITDLIQKASDLGEPIEMVSAPFDSIRGVNTLHDLWITEQIKRADIIKTFMSQGVRFHAPQSVHIDLNVSIEPDTTIHQGVQLRSGTRIGRGCTIDAFSIISNSTLQEGVSIYPHSIISDSELQAYAKVGPFAHIHYSSTLAPESVVGNFVEVTRTTLGTKSKAKHLSYLGDTVTGSEVNIGAGTITCNYNGVSKHTTTIHNNALIGSNTALVAPIVIGPDTIIGAGSVITQDVPAESLALSRTTQITKEYYAPKLKEKYKKALSEAFTYPVCETP